MKRLILLLVALLSVVLLASCNDNVEKTPSGAGNESVLETYRNDTEPAAPASKEDGIGMTAEEKAKYYKVIEFDLPKGDFRDIAVGYMRKQSSIEWVCTEDFSVSEKWDYWGISLDFKKGETYHGFPYADTKVSYIQFENALVNGGYTNKSSSWKMVHGVQCVSSIMNAIQQFDSTVAGSSNVLMPSYNTFEAKICGDYTVPENAKKTVDIRDANGQNVIFEAYMQLKKGDIIFTKNDSHGTSHFRMVVEEPTIYKNPNGKIVPSRCAVKTIEQTNAFDPQRTDGVKTTWFVDHVYSFSKLYDTSYLPITLESYGIPRTEMVKPHIILDEEVSSDRLAKGSFYTSSVKSNFPIRYVQVDILNADGQVVASKIKGNMEDTRHIYLRESFNILFNNLESGTYTMVLTAGLAIDSAELQRVEFIYTAK